MPLPIPDPHAVIADLPLIFSTLYAGFEAATQDAREYFESHGKAPDPYLYPAIVRHSVKTDLLDGGLPVVDYQCDDLANNGLKFSCVGVSGRRYDIRILKAEDGGLPYPGDSRLRLRFWRQEQFLMAFMRDGDPDLAPLALVVLWDVTANYNFWNLQLSCPRNGSYDPRISEAYWTVPLPHPVEEAGAAQPHQDDAEDDDVGFGLQHDDTGTDDGGEDSE